MDWRDAKMNSEPLSNNISAVETNKSRDGIRIRDGEWTGLMPYEDFPQFREANHSQVVKIEKPSPEQYSWPDLGIAVDRQTVENSQGRKRGLKRMRLLALGLLVFMGAVFIVASAGLDQWPWLGYVRAFAEAAMVGALADWFAVTALFRHPLGLPIPHTNIVQKRKDDIGQSLAAFVKNNFLTEQNIEKRLEGIDLANELSRWLKDKNNARELSLTVCRALRAVIDNDSGELEAFMSRTFRGVLDRVKVNKLIAQLLSRLVSDDQTKVLIDKLVDLGHEYFDKNRPRLRERVREEAGFGRRMIAGKVFDRLSEALRATLNNMHGDPKVRQEFDERIKLLAWEFDNDPETEKKTETYKQKFLNSPEAAEFLSHTWEELKSYLVRILKGAKDRDPALAEDIAKLLDRLGDMLAEEPFVRQMMNERLKAAIPSFVSRYRDGLSGGISKTVAGWDAKQTSDRIELHIGKDLQFIRINGTLVGGLVGLLIYMLSQLAFSHPG